MFGPDSPASFARLRVFDAAGGEIGAVTSAPGVTQTLCTSATGIRGARFSGARTMHSRASTTSP